MIAASTPTLDEQRQTVLAHAGIVHFVETGGTVQNLAAQLDAGTSIVSHEQCCGLRRLVVGSKRVHALGQAEQRQPEEAVGDDAGSVFLFQHLEDGNRDERDQREEVVGEEDEAYGVGRHGEEQCNQIDLR